MEKQPRCLFSKCSEIYFNDLSQVNNIHDSTSCKHKICDAICRGLNVQHHHFLTTDDVIQSNKIYVNRSYPFKYQNTAKLSEYCKNMALIIEKKEAI